ncbi:MAG TPA: CocE/NonD family hydrolase [Candidatus Binataceae bacterium]|nr:CocE/NonD family hydrolase [Candidatus Binataceae bacterium]
MNERHVTFRSGDLTLEGLIYVPAGNAAAPAAVVCHPHPAYGGSMDNNVVEAILDAMWQLGYATLRFNFRGVGASEGAYGGGEGEGDDAAAAVGFLTRQSGVSAAGAVLAGYSFGAMVALVTGLRMAEVARVVAVALPVSMTPSAVAAAPKPVLLVSGDRDSYSPVAGLRSLTKGLGKSARLEIVPGADHFFGGFEAALSGAIVAALGGR